MENRNIMEFNTHYQDLFDGFDKAKAFDEIANMFYNRNFSTTTKAEIELLMFSYYMDMTIKKYTDSEDRLDYSKCSIFAMAKQLGITPERVRTLKIKKQSRYPVEFDWMESLKALQDNIRYDGKKIIIPIIDPNLLNEIRDYVETKGGYVEIETSRSYLRIRIEYYLTLMYCTFSNDEQEEFRKKLKEKLKASNKIDESYDYPTTGDKIGRVNDILSIAANSIGVIKDVTGCFAPQNKLADILCKVLERFLH